MRRKMARWPLGLMLGCLAAAVPAGAAPRITDSVLGHFVGSWTVTGTTRGKPTATGAEVTAEFGGAFVELHIKDPLAKTRYEARVFIGGAEGGGLVAHWLDATGGETSRTLGVGQVAADAITLTFPYPDGAFHDRLSYDKSRDSWRLLIETGLAGDAKVFSDWAFVRVKAR